MEIKMDKNGANLTVTLTGRLDTMTSPQLEEELQKNLDGVTDLTFDFKDLEYISSAGLRVLLSTQKHMMRAGEMKVINVSDTIMEIFNVTGFSDIMNVSA
jgi:anti-sigma B factor antagonist